MRRSTASAVLIQRIPTKESNADHCSLKSTERRPGCRHRDSRHAFPRLVGKTAGEGEGGFYSTSRAHRQKREGPTEKRPSLFSWPTATASRRPRATDNFRRDLRLLVSSPPNAATHRAGSASALFFFFFFVLSRRQRSHARTTRFPSLDADGPSSNMGHNTAILFVSLLFQSVADPDHDAREISKSSRITGRPERTRSPPPSHPPPTRSRPLSQRSSEEEEEEAIPRGTVQKRNQEPYTTSEHLERVKGGAARF